VLQQETANLRARDFFRTVVLSRPEAEPRTSEGSAFF
jgi:hypothetical protein